MLDVFRDGFDAHVAFHEGTETVEFPTAAWRLARERFGEDAKQSSLTGSPRVRQPKNSSAVS